MQHCLREGNEVNAGVVCAGRTQILFKIPKVFNTFIKDCMRVYNKHSPELSLDSVVKLC